MTIEKKPDPTILYKWDNISFTLLSEDETAELKAQADNTHKNSMSQIMVQGCKKLQPGEATEIGPFDTAVEAQRWRNTMPSVAVALRWYTGELTKAGKKCKAYKTRLAPKNNKFFIQVLRKDVVTPKS